MVPDPIDPDLPTRPLVLIDGPAEDWEIELLKMSSEIFARRDPTQEEIAQARVNVARKAIRIA